MLTVPSRFQCLRLLCDDSDEEEAAPKKAPPPGPDKKALNKKDKDPKKTNKITLKSNKNNPIAKNKKSNEIWDDERPAEIDLGFDNEDLRRAIALSKREYEEEKKKAEGKKAEDNLKTGKKKKKAASVIETATENKKSNHVVRYVPNAVDDLGETKNGKSPGDDDIDRLCLQVVIDEKNKEIVNLQNELKKIKDELLKVKNRNKQLCSIIAKGEMNEKAELIEEIERLKEINVDLNSEVQSLHTHLEQERSRSARDNGRDRSDPRTRDKKK